MNKNTIGTRFKKTLAKNNRVKSIIYKSIFTIVILLFIVLFTKINTNPTNRLVETIKTNINYEFQVKEDSVRIYNRAKDVFNSTLDSIPVFNTEDKLDLPITGTIIRTFDSQVETPDGSRDNGGIEIKLEDEMDPKSITEGRVTNVEQIDNKGHFITVEEGEVKIIYGYLQSTPLKEGDLVQQEDTIGEVGINKDGSKYLRLELYINNELVDPEEYIDF